MVYNTGGYETVETVQALAEYVDIWLADVKYVSPTLGQTYSAAPDYFEVCSAAVRQMLAQTGAPQSDADGILQSGVILRHLALPARWRTARPFCAGWPACPRQLHSQL